MGGVGTVVWIDVLMIQVVAALIFDYLLLWATAEVARVPTTSRTAGAGRVARQRILCRYTRWRTKASFRTTGLCGSFPSSSSFRSRMLVVAFGATAAPASVRGRGVLLRHRLRQRRRGYGRLVSHRQSTGTGSGGRFIVGGRRHLARRRAGLGRRPAAPLAATVSDAGGDSIRRAQAPCHGARRYGQPTARSVDRAIRSSSWNRRRCSKCCRRICSPRWSRWRPAT